MIPDLGDHKYCEGLCTPHTGRVWLVRVTFPKRYNIPEKAQWSCEAQRQHEMNAGNIVDTLWIPPKVQETQEKTKESPPQPPVKVNYTTPDPFFNKVLSLVQGSRREAYGGVRESFDRIAEYWNTYIRSKVQQALTEINSQCSIFGPEISDVDTHANHQTAINFIMASKEMKELIQAEDTSLLMNLLKVARHQSGGSSDDVIDIAGYAWCLWQLELENRGEQEKVKETEEDTERRAMTEAEQHVSEPMDFARDDRY